MRGHPQIAATLYNRGMADKHYFNRTQTVQLAAGAQAVINGALVTVRQDCTLEVGAGAFVLTGRGLWHGRGKVRHPSEELYFSLLDCGSDDARFHDERFRLFGLLSEVVAQDRSYEAQRECAQCAAALMGNDIKAAVQSAARMAAERPLPNRAPNRTTRPPRGRPAQKRSVKTIGLQRAD